MPRVGDIYTQPHDDVDPDTTIESVVYNAFTRDVELDLNTPRPIIAGGTGSNSIDGALAALHAEKANQIVTNFSSHAWTSGSFSSATTASNPPVADHAFSGVAHVVDADNMTIEARDRSDTTVPGRRYVREKKAGAWSAWVMEDANSKVAKAGDTMTGHLTLPENATPDAAHAVRKDYVDSTAREIIRRDNIITPHEKLRLAYNSAATVILTADALLLFTAAGASKRFTAFNTTLAITTAGAGGLDAGSEAASTWYHVWAIGKADGTKSAVFSTSASAPTLPTDYIYYGYVGAAFNNASSNFEKFTQLDTRVYATWDWATGQILANATGTSYSSINCTGVVPPTATAIVIQPGLGLNPPSSAAAAITAYFASAGSGTTPTTDESFVTRYVFSNEVGKGYIPGAVVPMVSPQQIVYRVAGTAASVNVYSIGWLF